MKCDRCGLQSDVELAFCVEKRLFRKTRHYCPGCTTKREARTFIVGMAIFLGSGLFLFALNPTASTISFILGLTLLIFLMIPLVIVHELAHAGVANLLGLRVFGIVIGSGKTIWSGKFLGLDWIVNALPILGITSVGPRPVPHIRLRLFLIYLAGPASHVLMALAAFLLQIIVPASTLSHRLLSTVITANLLSAAIGLFPQKVSTMAGMQGTDGWHLLHVPFLKESELAKRYVGYYAGEALQAYAAHNLNEAEAWLDKAIAVGSDTGAVRNVLGIIQMARGEYPYSRSTFLQVLETEEGKEPGLHYTLLNNIAYLDALLQDACLLPEADRLSSEAFEHLPWVPAVMGTRGAVLVELGQLPEGLALLKKSMSLHTDKRSKALNACHIAIGESRGGNLRAARKYLSAAKMLDPDCILIPRVEAQITGSDGYVLSGLPIEAMDQRP